MSEIYFPREDSYLLEKYVSLFAEKSVLEIGIGSGIQSFTAAVKKEVTFVIGIDINQKAVNHSTKLAKQKVHKNVLFLQSNLFKNLYEKNFSYDKKKNEIVITKKVVTKEITDKNKKKNQKIDNHKVWKYGSKTNNQENHTFHTIILNPPYLPEDGFKKDIALIGGKHGYEIIEQFLNEVNTFLHTNGRILLLFSSKTGKEKVDTFIENNLLEYTLLEEKYIGGFETLFVYDIKKTDILKELERKGLQDIHKFSKGHRGDIFIADWKNRHKKSKNSANKNNEKDSVAKVIIKKQRANIQIETIRNEITVLKKVNKKRIGPKLFFADDNSKEPFFVCEYINGIKIEEFLEKKSKKEIQKVLKNIFEQCFILDTMQLTKEEMHRPYKHIIVKEKVSKDTFMKEKNTKLKKNKQTKEHLPILLDFERCRYDSDPKNVTQFCQYVTSQRIRTLLERKKFTIDIEKIRKTAKEYKENKDISSLLKSVGIDE